MFAVVELEAAREAMKQQMPIGEPAVPLNSDHVLVNSKNPHVLHIRMDHLIEMVEKILKDNLKIDDETNLHRAS